MDLLITRSSNPCSVSSVDAETETETERESEERMRSLQSSRMQSQTLPDFKP
jgi:hypothetical protein